MTKANIPSNKLERLHASETYTIFDILSEADYDAFTKIAAVICNTPIALISMIYKDKQWLKSKHELNSNDMPKDISFCAHTILHPDELFIVNDASKDKRFCDNPLVFEDSVVTFYAGATLSSSEGYPFGTLCVIDNKPNELNESQRESLKLLAKQVVNLLEIRKKNSELVKTNKAVSVLNKQLTEFSHRLSHDIKTPISGIKYLSEIIQKEYSDILDTQGKSWLKLISTRSTYLYSLVEGILNFTKATNIEIISEVFNFKSVLEQIKMPYNQKQNYHVDYINCDVDLKQSKIAIIQIFENLLSNSRKFVSKSNILISINLEVTKDFYLITYKDNGPGINDKYHKKVFKLFETLENSKSTGIGLSSVSSILKRLGGSIGILSSQNKSSGLTFNIKIPMIKD
jgi:hypothetical protein